LQKGNARKTVNICDVASPNNKFLAILGAKEAPTPVSEIVIFPFREAV
jgi:hypothetical protein